MFDYEGNYIAEVRIPYGNGPGELMHMRDLLITDDQKVFALGAHKIVEYNKEGEFIDEITFEFFAYNFTYYPDEDLFITSAENDLNRRLGDEFEGYNLIYLNREGDIVETKLPIPA